MFVKCPEVLEQPLSPRIMRVVRHHLMIKKLRKMYDPIKDSKMTEDSTRTLFIRNLAYSVGDETLKQHLREFGKIRDLRVV